MGAAWDWIIAFAGVWQHSATGKANRPSTGGNEMPRNERHVVPDPDGGWDVKAPGGGRSSGHFPTQEKAIDRAREIVRNTGGGEVVIHDRGGRVRDSDTVPPGNDPNPPRDTR
jgi:hypothetical protein